MPLAAAPSREHDSHAPSAPATLTEIPVALVDCPEDAESIANECTRENELCTCSESYGNCPTDYSSYGLGLCGIKFRASP